MGEWQKNELAGEEDIVYLIAMTENCASSPAAPSELANWQAELGFDAITMTDPVRDVWNAYADANACGPTPVGGPGCSNAVTVLIDREMRIRHFGETYSCGTGDGSRCGEPANVPPGTAECLNGTLAEIQNLLAE